jgi:hypothetical protein
LYCNALCSEAEEGDFSQAAKVAPSYVWWGDNEQVRWARERDPVL